MQKYASGWTCTPQVESARPAAGAVCDPAQFGYCRVDAQNELAEIFDIEPAEVGGVVDFYHMFKTEPTGEYHVEVCTNVPCMLRGAGQCMHHFEEKLGIHHGEMTEDGKFSLGHMECLGSCGTAPMAMVTERATDQRRAILRKWRAPKTYKRRSTCWPLARASLRSNAGRLKATPKARAKRRDPTGWAAWNTRC